MPFAIQIYFDGSTSQAIRRVWAALAETGVAPYLHESADQPHLSLALYEGLDVGAGARDLQDFAAATPAFPITLASLGLFCTEEPVVFAAPVVTADLLALHARVCERLGSLAQQPWDYYRPQHWVPHCSLALRFPAERIHPAMDVCRTLPLPLYGQIAAIGAMEIEPARPLFSFPLASAAVI